ncbi:MAG: hypothetical protein ABEI86_02080 [Halobacteriaceae archaeon]
MVQFPDESLQLFERFTLFNSPYYAHTGGKAIDLYPDNDRPSAPSPIAGTVTQIHSVEAPTKSYAADQDYLLIIETANTYVRILHVDPTVREGDYVARGESLGTLIRSGYFAPWVANHLHVEFRPLQMNPIRAKGSLPIYLESEIVPIAWDGTGTVQERDNTYVILDSPTHSQPGEYFVGFGSDSMDRVIDGGLPHYPNGGVIADYNSEISFQGSVIGTPDNGRTLHWPDMTIHANNKQIHGLSLFCAKDKLYAKLICPDTTFPIGTEITVSIDP